MNITPHSTTIRLRAMEPEDLDSLYLIENDTELWAAGITNVPYSRFLLHHFIAHASGDIYADRQVRLMVDNEEGHTVGILDMVHFDPSHLRAEVGIVIQRAHRRKGYALAALHSLRTYAAQVIHLHQLFAIVDASNSPALSLFQTAGYRHTATLHHWLYVGSSYHDALLLQLILD